MPSPGRPPVLNDAKRKKIIALLAGGCSRRVAANFVGCAPSTLTRTILRDSDFADEVAQAETACELEALRNIRAAARVNRHWRAAAWLLERRNSIDFSKRKPDLYTFDAVKRVVDVLAELAFNGLSEKQNKIILERMGHLLQPDPINYGEPGRAADPQAFKNLEYKKNDDKKTLAKKFHFVENEPNEEPSNEEPFDAEPFDAEPFDEPEFNEDDEFDNNDPPIPNPQSPIPKSPNPQIPTKLFATTPPSEKP